MGDGQKAHPWDRLAFCSSMFFRLIIITHHPSPITHHPSPITHYPLPITHYPLPITHYPLPITHYPFPSAMSEDKEKFLSRWSRLKQDAKEQEAQQPAHPPDASNAPPPDLPPVEKLTFES